MGNCLNVGNAGFASMVADAYVDKTGLIAFMNQTLGTTNKLTCVSRPRRFGKSYAAKMLCAYYDKSCDSRALFEGLAITADSSFEKHLNKYDVIYLDVAWFIFVAGDVKNTVRELAERVIRELREAYPDARTEKTLPETMAAAVIGLLMENVRDSRFRLCLYELHGLHDGGKGDDDQRDGAFHP